MGSPNDVLDCDASAGRLCMCSTSGRDGHALCYLLLKLHDNVTGSIWTTVLEIVQFPARRHLITLLVLKTESHLVRSKSPKKACIISDWVLAFVRVLQYATHSPIKPPRKCLEHVHFTFAMALGKRG